MMNATDAVAAMRFLEHEAKDHDGEARRVLMDTAAYLGQQATQGVPSGVEAEICALIASRQRAGIAKYGMTVADNPLALRDWLQHALEEVLDQAVYLKRAINELDAMSRCDVNEMFQGPTDAMTLTGDNLTRTFDEGDVVIVMKVSP